MSKEAIYLRMPTALQNVAMSAYGLYLKSRRYNQEYNKLEKIILNRWALSADELCSIQFQRLKEIIHFAQVYVPYYKELFKSLDFSYQDIRSLKDIELLPLLDKQTVRSNIKNFYPDNLRELNFAMVKTSGTTGTSLSFPLTIDAEREQWAICWRYRGQFGLDRNTWYAHFYGKSVVPITQNKAPFWRVNYPGKQILFSAYHMNASNLRFYVGALNKFKPPWIQGYPSLLALLSDYILSENIVLDYVPKVVTIGSESLLIQQKEKIEKAFGAKCRQHYGMTEAVANISECIHGRLHVDEDFAYTEFLKNDTDNYNIVSTGFSNKGFVLIRYMLGDIARINANDNKCPCGNSGRIVDSIDGRKEDYVLLPDGTKIGRLDHILKDMREIRECQIVQSTRKSIVFRIVKASGYSEHDEKKLLSEAVKRLGSELNIGIEYVDKLERSKTGKLRFVVSGIESSKVA